MATTTRLGLPYPVSNDPADVPADIKKLADKLDPSAALDFQGTFANRPAPGIAGRYYFATDTTQLFRDDGSAWNAIPSVQDITRIAHVALSANTPQLNFAGIPQTFGHLLILGNIRRDQNTPGEGQITFNGDVSANYHTYAIQGNQSAVTGTPYLFESDGNIGFMTGDDSSPGVYSGFAVLLPAYAAAGSWRTWMSMFVTVRQVSTSAFYFGLRGGMWGKTPAITSIAFGFAGGGVAAGSFATLYGLRGA